MQNICESQLSLVLSQREYRPMRKEVFDYQAGSFNVTVVTDVLRGRLCIPNEELCFAKRLLQKGGNYESKALVLLLALVTAVAMAQPQGKGQGPIVEIQTLDSMCQSGTHMTVKTHKGNTEVALGPAKFPGRSKA